MKVKGLSEFALDKGIIKKYRRTRVMYLLEAAFEYFISLMLTGAYIAKVASSIGISDSMVGVITSITSLGAAFQVFALFLVGKHPVKRWVMASHVISQLFFCSVWLMPIFDIPKGVKIALFAFVLVGGQIIHNIINSPKISWYMSMVDDHKRGSFTSTKEIISLVGGMVFTFCMGNVVDYFEAKGELSTAFLVGGITMLTITVFHTITLIMSYERPAKKAEKQSGVLKALMALFKNRQLVRVFVFAVLAKMCLSIAWPFFGTYQNNELGFSMRLISVISILHVIVRVTASVFLGRFADRTSFAALLNLCLCIGMIGYITAVFCVPSNGVVIFILYYAVFEAVMQAGYGNGLMNLVYDCVDKSERTGAFALYNALSGSVGFITTLICSTVVTKIQANGNTVFGMHMYAQQFLSAVSVIVFIITILYLNFAIIRKGKKNV